MRCGGSFHLAERGIPVQRTKARQRARAVMCQWRMRRMSAALHSLLHCVVPTGPPLTRSADATRNTARRWRRLHPSHHTTYRHDLRVFFLFLCPFFLFSIFPFPPFQSPLPLPSFPCALPDGDRLRGFCPVLSCPVDADDCRSSGLIPCAQRSFSVAFCSCLMEGGTARA